MRKVYEKKGVFSIYHPAGKRDMRKICDLFGAHPGEELKYIWKDLMIEIGNCQDPLPLSYFCSWLNHYNLIEDGIYDMDSLASNTDNGLETLTCPAVLIVFDKPYNVEYDEIGAVKYALIDCRDIYGDLPFGIYLDSMGPDDFLDTDRWGNAFEDLFGEYGREIDDHLFDGLKNKAPRIYDDIWG